MQRSEFDALVEKVEDLEAPRTLSPGQREAWFEIFGGNLQADAMAAVRAFHSKPFERPIYPGDIKAHILEIEGVRLRRCGTIEANQEEWFHGPLAPVYAMLRSLISSGEWTPDDYRGYQRSKLTLEQYLEKQGAAIG